MREFTIQDRHDDAVSQLIRFKGEQLAECSDSASWKHFRLYLYRTESGTMY